jgi:cell wall-associated NlpC family hydrolase
MPFKSNKPASTSSVLVAAVLSIVIALPVMSQPLGIATVISQDAVTQKQAADSVQEPEAPLTALSEPENISYDDEVFSRSQNDLQSSDEQGVLNTAAATEVSENEQEAADNTSAEPEPAESESADDIAEPALSADFSAVSAGEPELFEPIDKYLYVTATSLNLREKADAEAEIKAELPMGTKVRATADNGDWLYVASGDTCGFIAAEYTSSEMVFVPVDQTRYVKADKLNLRESFADDADVLEVLARDAKLVRIGVGDGWSYVKTASGKKGYVVSEYLTSTVPASLQPKMPALQNGSLAGSASRENLVAIAKSGIGVPYVYGGSSLSGFDCSGFTSWVYRQVGITIPRSTSGYYNAGVGVSLSEAKPGDIVCMDANSRDGRTSITHVGVYIGNGQMLHASTSKQRIVSVNVNTFFNYGIKLITVRRFVN